jgi:hypothetical protein
MHQETFMHLTAHRHQVAASLSSLELSLEGLTAALAHGDTWVEIEPAPAAERSPAGPIRRACEAYSAINYAMEDEVGDSATCLGAIGVRTEVSPPRRGR